jgi:hypothetical protein
MAKEVDNVLAVVNRVIEGKVDMILSEVVDIPEKVN